MSRRGGYSLVEASVSLGLAVLTLGLALGMSVTGNQLGHKSSDLADWLSSAAALQEQLGRDLRAGDPRDLELDPEPEVGTASGQVFLVLRPEDASGEVIRYSREEDVVVRRGPGGAVRRFQLAADQACRLTRSAPGSRSVGLVRVRIERGPTSSETEADVLLDSAVLVEAPGVRFPGWNPLPAQ